MSLLAKKSLGQHFLNSKHVLEQIIEAAKIQKEEIILEIGPGTGILTDALLLAGANVIAIEKDDRAFALLQEKYALQISEGKLDLVHGDILETDVDDLLNKSEITSNSNSRDKISAKKYSIIANIPYYITGAILQKFLENAPRPDRMVLLVQKEVADRIVAHDGKESILSISVKAFCTPTIIARVPRGAFTPPPNVDSAIISLDNISAKKFAFELRQDMLMIAPTKDIPAIDEARNISRFFTVLKAGFAHKRKFLIRNLEDIAILGDTYEVWDYLKLDEKIRAEDLKLEDWFNITSLLCFYKSP